MTLAPGRECGDCTMCCKLAAVPELAKPANVWCKHVAQGVGCKIHDTRPTSCSTFDCQWLLDPTLGPEWKPNHAKFLLWRTPAGSWLVAVDPGNPNSWRQPQYLPQLRLLAARLAENNQPLLVFNRSKTTCILPDRDVELPQLEKGQAIAVITDTTQGRMRYDVAVVDVAAQS